MALTTLEKQIVDMMEQIYAGLYYKYKENYPKWDVSIVDTLPSQGSIRVFYFKRGTGTQGNQNKYDIYIWTETTQSTPKHRQYVFELIGQVSYDMRNHYTKAQFEERLTHYMDLDASSYVNDKNFVKIYYTPSATTKSKFDVSNDNGATKLNISNVDRATKTELTEYFYDKSNSVTYSEFDTGIGTITDMVNNAMYPDVTFTAGSLIDRHANYELVKGNATIKFADRSILTASGASIEYSYQMRLGGADAPDQQIIWEIIFDDNYRTYHADYISAMGGYCRLVYDKTTRKILMLWKSSSSTIEVDASSIITNGQVYNIKLLTAGPLYINGSQISGIGHPNGTFENMFKVGTGVLLHSILVKYKPLEDENYYTFKLYNE